MAINNQPTIKPQTVTGIFTRYIAKTIPLAFDESMSYYECLCALLEYINTKVMPDLNNVNDGLEELQNFYLELQSYVNNYFENLDVQDEINNKLDEMVEDGVLEQIIEQYINSSAIWGYDSVSDMKTATNLIDGSYARTLGYYSKNDGGDGLYKIRTITNDDVVDEGSIIALSNNTLIAELICENEINVKQFGAKGDGITDDSLSFVNALNYISNHNIKNLLINDGIFIVNNTQIILPNGIHLYGKNENESIIQINALTNEVFMTNEHYLDYDYQDTFTIENLRINKQALETGNHGKRFMRFACTNNIIIRNVIMYSDVNSQFGAIDLYSYNTNSLIENCKAYKLNSSTGLQNGGYAVREISNTHITENIILRDCYIEKDGKDESLWIDGWRGTVKNVLNDNFTLIDNSESDGANSAWVSGNDNGSICENITITNSYFYKKGLQYRIIAIGDSEVTNSTCTADNIKIINCIFETDTYVGSSTNSSLISVGKYLINSGCTLENNVIKNNDSDHSIPSFIHSVPSSPLFSINNKFLGKSQRSMYNIHSSKDDLFFLAPTVTLFQNSKNIDNVKCLESVPYLLVIQNNTTITDVTIKNSTNLSCTRVFQNMGNTYGINYRIINCQIENTNEICTNYSQTENLMSLTLINTDIKYSQITGASNINLKSSGLSINGAIFKGIPSNSNDRNNYPIGTVFFSNNATKSIVRKISEGNATSNWEEV